MKKRPDIILFAIIIAVVAIAVTLAIRRQPHPTYQNKTVDQWLAQSTTNLLQAQSAIQNMGAAALPDLIHVIRGHDPRVEKAYAWIYYRLPGFLQNILPQPKSSQNEQNLASLFLTQSPHVHDVLPDLVRLMQGNAANNFLLFGPLIKALTPADTNYISTFESWLRHTNLFAYQVAPQFLMKMGPAGAHAVPDLTKALGNSSPGVRLACAIALWEVAHLTNGIGVLKNAIGRPNPPNLPVIFFVDLHEMEPENLSAITNLIKALANPVDIYQLTNKFAYVGRKSPVGEVISILTNQIETDPGELHKTALKALRQIDPAAAAKYGNEVTDEAVKPGGFE